MKVLLSAYACEPNRGSEPGVGWNWALEIEKLGHQVWVLTRKNNQSVIEKYYQYNSKPDYLNFIYYDVPKWLSWWKKGGRGVYLYYLLWQIGAYFAARESHKKNKFEKVQHSTFVTVRQPSFMGLLGIPFIFGPVGGGERAPYALRKGFGIKGWIKDFLRDIANIFVRLDPLMHLTFFTADIIYATSEQTKQVIPAFYRHKVKIQLAIGYDLESIKQPIKTDQKQTKATKFLYVGRFEYWKGMGLGIQAFAKFSKIQPEATLTMVGKGPDEKRWRLLANKLGVADKITWMSWVQQKELQEIYLRNDVFLFPSLHDSGGMVVLEAMAHGLPVVCAMLGGPGLMVNDQCGFSLPADNFGNGLANVLIKLSGDSYFGKRLSLGAVKRVEEFTWCTAVESVYRDYK